MKIVSMLGAAFALALPLLSASRPAAAADVKAIAVAVGDSDPFAMSWVDTADGKLDLDDSMAGQIHDLFAGVQYILTDSGQLLLAQGSGSNVNLIVPAANQVHNSKNTDFVVHVRSKDARLFLDGEIVRYSSDPSKGFASFTLLLLDGKGGSVSTLIDQDLSFASSTGSVDLNVKSG